MSKRGKSGNYRGRSRKTWNPRVPWQREHFEESMGESVEESDKDYATIQQFRMYKKMLEEKQKKYEKKTSNIVKSISGESKDIIDILHSIESGDKKKEEIFKEVEGKLRTLITEDFYLLAIECIDENSYYYHKAFQDFIKAHALFDYIRSGEFHHWDTYQKKLTYKSPAGSAAETVQAYISPTDYMLGLADLSGELVKMCLNNRRTGDKETCLKTLDIITKLHTGFLGISNRNKDLKQKMSTLQENLRKIENVCYNNTILKKVPVEDVAQEEYVDEDEGCYI